jgi:hypothetical protein
MPIQRKITGNDLVKQSLRNELILKSKLPHAVLLTIILSYTVSFMNSRVLQMMPLALGAGLIVADHKSRERKLRQISVAGEDWTQYADAETREYLGKVATMNNPISTLEMILPEDSIKVVQKPSATPKAGMSIKPPKLTTQPPEKVKSDPVGK